MSKPKQEKTGKKMSNKGWIDSPTTVRKRTEKRRKENEAKN